MVKGQRLTEYLSEELAGNPDLKEELDESFKDFDLAVQLAIFREKRGLTQQALSLLSGIQQPMISRIETGDQEPTWSTLRKLLNSLQAVFIAQPNGEVTLVETSPPAAGYQDAAVKPLLGAQANLTESFRIALAGMTASSEEGLVGSWPTLRRQIESASNIAIEASAHPPWSGVGTEAFVASYQPHSSRFRGVVRVTSTEQIAIGATQFGAATDPSAKGRNPNVLPFAQEEPHEQDALLQTIRVA